MRSLAALLLAIVGVGGCAPAAAPSGPLEPVAVGANFYMTVEWQAAPRGQATAVWGYVNNHSPYTFEFVQVLVDALGPDGAVVSQRVVWAPGFLAGGGGRNYFEATITAAHSYRVRVFSAQRVEGDGLRRRWPF